MTLRVSSQLHGPDHAWNGPQGLARSLDRLSPEGLDGLRRQAGGSLSVLRSLSRETNDELFFGDLLSYAQELERDGASQLAREIYLGIDAAETAGPALRNRARHQVALMNGEGPWPEQLERSCGQWLDQVTAPELLLGMGVGSLTYGLGRFASLAGLRRVGLSGLSLRLGSRAVGVAAEAGAFVSVTHGVQVLQGERPFSQWHAGWGSDWWHTLGLLLTLRTVGWGTGRWIEAKGLPRSAWEWSLARAGQQTAMGLGLFAYHYGEARWDGRETSWPQLFSQTLAELVVFQGAGHLSRNLWGPRIHALEASLEAGSRRLETPVRLFPQILGPRLQPAGTPVEWGFQQAMMVGDGDGTGRRTRGTGPRPLIPRALRGKEPQYPHRFESEPMFRAHLGNERLMDQLLNHHAYWSLPEQGTLTTDMVREALNSYAKLDRVPRGRLVQVRFEDNQGAMEFQKLGREFLTTRRPTGKPPRPDPTPTPPTIPPRRRYSSPTETRRDLKEVVERMEALARRDSRPSVPGVSAEQLSTTSQRITLVPGIEATSAGRADPVRYLYTQADFQEMLRELQGQAKERSTTEIFLALPTILKETQLRVLTNYLMGFPEGSSLRIHEEATRKTYFLQRMDKRPQGNSRDWLPPIGNREVRTDQILELFQGLSFFRGKEPGLVTLPLQVKWLGPWDAQYHPQTILSHFNGWDRFFYQQIHFEFAESAQAQGAPDTGPLILRRSRYGRYRWEQNR